MKAILSSTLKNLAACMTIAVLAACDNPLDDYQPAGEDSGMVCLQLNVPQIEETVVTRAGNNDADQVIYSAQVFVFDKSGHCVYKNPLYNEYADRIPYNTSLALGIPVMAGDNSKECSVYVFANIAIWDAAPTGAYNFDRIDNLEDLKKVYSYRTLQSSFPEARDHRPMTGIVEGVDLTKATSIGAPYEVEMKRILAKINFQIKVGLGFSFYFNGWSLENMPRYTLAVPQAQDFAYAGVYDAEDRTNYPHGLYFPDPIIPSEVTLTNIAVQNPKWISGDEENNASDTVSFFMYENRRGGRTAAPNWDNVQGTIQLNYNDNSNAPQYKTLYAPENASFIVVKGLIKKNYGNENDVESVRSFSYKIALGKNNTDDYNIERNHSYTYTLNINGMTNNDVSVEVNQFDSRAHRNHGIHIAAPNIDHIDAHYDKRYINVTATPGKIDFALYNTLEEAKATDGKAIDNARSWVRLSKINTYNIDIAEDENTTQSLDFNTAEPNRVLYLYTQENASTRQRTAVLKVSHTIKNANDLPSEGSDLGDHMEIISHETGKITINYYYYVKQAGLLPVTMTLSNGATRTFYVESYEEYKMALDPTYTKQTEGLPWGWCIEKAGNTVYNYNFAKGTYQLASGNGSLNTATDTVYGLANTQAITGAESHGEAFPGVIVSSEKVEEVYGNYAAHYCYNKNKRDKNGQIIASEAKWYMPAFTELRALTRKNYAAQDAPDGWTPFVTNAETYWSSTVPTDNTVIEKPHDGWFQFLDRLGLGNAVWDYITNNYIGEGRPNEYRNVAISVKNGELQQTEDKYGTWVTYPIKYYTSRSTPLDVRAVRSAEGVIP